MCGSCERRWLNSKARCDRCQRYRRPALGEANAGLCEMCAGIKSTQVCGRCGAEEDLYASARCAACYLADEIDRFRATGDPAAIKTLDRYLAALQTAGPANSVLHWLRISRTSAAPILRDMLAGARPITHDALDQAPAGHAAEFLRAALVKHGALPERDEVCHRFERWIIAATEQLPDHPDRADLRRWATWIVLRDLRARRRASLTASDRAARLHVLVTRDFVAWLHEQHITLATTSTTRRRPLAIRWPDQTTPDQRVPPMDEPDQADRAAPRTRPPRPAARHRARRQRSPRTHRSAPARQRPRAPDARRWAPHPPLRPTTRTRHPPPH